jgi:hypothetical protein
MVLGLEYCRVVIGKILIGRVRFVVPPFTDEPFFCLFDVVEATRTKPTIKVHHATLIKIRTSQWFVESRDLFK